MVSDASAPIDRGQSAHRRLYDQKGSPTGGSAEVEGNTMRRMQPAPSARCVHGQALRDARKSKTAVLKALGFRWFIGCDAPGMVTRRTSLRVCSNASRIRP